MKTCRACSVEFEQPRGRRAQIYCSVPCRTKFLNDKHNAVKGERPVRPCSNCGGPLQQGASLWCRESACQEAKREAAHEAAKARARDRRASDPEFRERNRRACREWQSANRALRLELDRRRYREDPTKAKQAALVRKALKREATVVPFTAEQLAQRMSMYSRCWICGNPRWTEADHVKPLAKGGPHMLANLRPACGTCNRRKGSKWPFVNLEGL